MTVYYPLLRYYFPQANGNWDGAIIHFLLAIAVYTDNKVMFDNAINHFMYAPVNGSIFKYIYPSGQCQESTRDQGHVQLGLGEFAGAARIAFTQGIDLFSLADNRIALGYEYTASFLLGNMPHCYGRISERAKNLSDINEHVCLGAGISCKQQLPVATTINQCLLRGDVTLSANNRKSVIAKGEKQFEHVDWIFHDGIGYVFPEPTEIQLKNSAATGSWWNISKQSDSPKEEVSLDIFKLWVTHGERPSDASYEYIVVPATSVEKLEQNSSKNNITILANTPEIQAVMNTDLEICQAVFYKGGEVEIAENLNLLSDNPGIAMLKMKNGQITEISVADPNRELTRFNLSVSVKIEKSGENFSVEWDANTGLTHVSIVLPRDNYAGDSVTIKL